MRFSAIFPVCFFLIFCWIGGANLNAAAATSQKTAQELPYVEIMHEAVNELRLRGVTVEYPRTLPQLQRCSGCLALHEAFGAYQMSTDKVVMPDDFDVMSVEGRAILIHEYGHFVMTRAGVAAEKQEELCLMLGNGVYRRAFSLAANP
jgi:hypothetical protein